MTWIVLVLVSNVNRSAATLSHIHAMLSACVRFRVHGVGSASCHTSPSQLYTVQTARISYVLL